MPPTALELGLHYFPLRQRRSRKARYPPAGMHLALDPGVVRQRSTRTHAVSLGHGTGLAPVPRRADRGPAAANRRRRSHDEHELYRGSIRPWPAVIHPGRDHSVIARSSGRPSLTVWLSLAGLFVLLLAPRASEAGRPEPENTRQACTDRKDNDRDGLVDCADPDCAGIVSCPENTTARCVDGRDNDLDGKIDCADPDCTGVVSCPENTTARCSDARDNDLDGLIDCADPELRRHRQLSREHDRALQRREGQRPRRPDRLRRPGLHRHRQLPREHDRALQRREGQRPRRPDRLRRPGLRRHRQLPREHDRALRRRDGQRPRRPDRLRRSELRRHRQLPREHPGALHRRDRQRPRRPDRLRRSRAAPASSAAPRTPRRDAPTGSTTTSTA